MRPEVESAAETTVTSMVPALHLCACSHAVRDHEQRTGLCIWRSCSCGAYEPVYGASDVIDAAGITYRQLDHWIRCGYLPDSRPLAERGSWRSFTAAELDLVRTVAAMVGELRIQPSRAFQIAWEIADARSVLFRLGRAYVLFISTIPAGSPEPATPEEATAP